MIKAIVAMELRLAEQDHRTANMLHLVACLLGWHATRAADQATAAALGVAEAQIRAFALLNEALHGPACGVACGAAYLRALSGHLQSACLAPRGLGLDLRLPSRAPMDCHDAQLMGLLVVEAVTNAVKHAFPDERPGCLTISLVADPAGATLQCTVSDDGMGMADGEGERSGRGLKFMRALANGLGGTLLIGAGAVGSWISFRVPAGEDCLNLEPKAVLPAVGVQQALTAGPMGMGHGQA